MNETDQILEGFITNYRSRQVPPPHILLAGPDSALNESIARNFAARLGVEFEAKDAATIGTIGDLTSVLWGKRITFIGNIHLLKKASVRKRRTVWVRLPEPLATRRRVVQAMARKTPVGRRTTDIPG